MHESTLKKKDLKRFQKIFTPVIGEETFYECEFIIMDVCCDEVKSYYEIKLLSNTNPLKNSSLPSVRAFSHRNLHAQNIRSIIFILLQN